MRSAASWVTSNVLLAGILSITYQGLSGRPARPPKLIPCRWPIVYWCRPRCWPSTLPWRSVNGAGLIVNVLAEEVGKSTLADKTDASAVLLAVIGQSQRRCQTSYVGFCQSPKGKRQRASLCLGTAVRNRFGLCWHPALSEIGWAPRGLATDIRWLSGIGLLRT